MPRLLNTSTREVVVTPVAANQKEPLSRRDTAPPFKAASNKSPSSTVGIAVRFTIVTTILLGILYPLIVTGLAQLTMRDKADGQLITRNGHAIGSKLIAQSFTSARYFHERRLPQETVMTRRVPAAPILVRQTKS